MLSDETYSNVGITFDVNGNDVDTILESGDTITFTITFYYNNYQLPRDGNNTLTSLLNFQYSKIYYVTYENFTSTYGYPTFVREGDTLTVSFGTLDAPIEVKRAGVIVSSSEYSYSAYILNYSNITAAIHIRKLTAYTIQNMLINSSFENSFNQWDLAGTNGWGLASGGYHGSYFAYRPATSTAAVNFIRQNVSWTAGHKYYFFGYAISQTPQEFACNITNIGDKFSVMTNSSYWVKGSVIHTAPKTAESSVSINYAPTTDNVNCDAFGVVDLTLAFGAGNEPDKAWCDANIDYFVSKTIVYR